MNWPSGASEFTGATMQQLAQLAYHTEV